MYTFQDFEKSTDKIGFVRQLITYHMTSPEYAIARDADLYDHQRNKTINEYVRVLYDVFGNSIENYIAANNKIASNFFSRLNTQRCTYSLGNGVSFTDHVEEQVDTDGATVFVDLTKEKLGKKFDTDLYRLAYHAIIHAVAFGYWNSERLYTFPITEFAPLWDENDGTLRAGVRFWRLAADKPLIAVLYEEDGFTKYGTTEDSESLKLLEEKRPYKILTRTTKADGEVIVGTENYGSLPIIPLWGSRLKQSTLIGMREAIDSYDLIRSGFANDLNDCAEIYWLIENYGGMSDGDLMKFRDKLKFMHIAEADTSESGKITPYTQEIPYGARSAYLDIIRKGIYEDFGGLDVHEVSANSTNDHLEAAYQPLDENADDFEYQVIEFIQQLLSLEGIEDTPLFQRNRISNEMERTQMILMAANYLDERTILQKLPFITVDEIANIMATKTEEDTEKYVPGAFGSPSFGPEDEEAQEDAEV